LYLCHLDPPSLALNNRGISSRMASGDENFWNASLTGVNNRARS
jgi:hypothetical protein